MDDQLSPDGPKASAAALPQHAQSFPRFYAAHAEQVLRFFARRTYDPQVALDLTAETFAEAFMHRRRCRADTPAGAQAWLFAIARHQLGRYLRRGRVEQRALRRLGIATPVAVDEELSRIEELADLKPLREIVALELANLSVEHREALRLRVVDELPYSVIADRLVVSEQTARARVSRGLGALARALGEAPLTGGGTP